MGYAILTAATQQFLNTCEAVTSWRELDGYVVVFDYDPAVEVSIVPPGVYFDLDTCTDDGDRERIQDAIDAQ